MLQQYLKKVFFVFGLMVLANFASDTGSPWESRGEKIKGLGEMGLTA
jgi:hypothetical protein